MLECPQNYSPKIDCKNSSVSTTCTKSCIQCNDSCQKICSSTVIDSVSAAKAIKGCTRLEGGLEIAIRSQGSTNIVRELEQSLSSLEEITEYLKITRSYPLISLHFFKSLRRIGGENIDSKENKALIVIDNPNLQDLFDPNRTVTIGKGKIVFHYNPKLCIYKIEEFKKKLGSNIEYDSEESTRTTNGDKIACNVTEIAVTATQITHQFAVLRWDKFEYHDYRSLLGYVVFVIEAPFQNVSLYDGRDACGSDG